MRRRWWLGVLVGALLTSACAKKSALTGGGGTQDAPAGVPVIYDATVPDDQRQALNDAISKLSTLNIKDGRTAAEIQLAKVVGVTEFSRDSLTDWLKKRLRYVTGDAYDVKTNTVTQQSSYYYRPELFASVASFARNAANPVTRMSNIGAGAYLDGQNASKLVALNVGGEQKLVDTPRVGIFKIGPGLFAPAATRTAIVQALDVLGTLFHESRHDDGNGAHVAFAHATCPSWHDYADSYACDSASNGPYMIQAILLAVFSDSCTECDARDKEVLKTLIADRVNRKLPGATEKDPTPEKVKP